MYESILQAKNDYNAPVSNILTLDELDHDARNRKAFQFF